jgi:hypothetical protein
VAYRRKKRQRQRSGVAAAWRKRHRGGNEKASGGIRQLIENIVNGKINAKRGKAAYQSKAAREKHRWRKGVNGVSAAAA